MFADEPSRANLISGLSTRISIVQEDVPAVLLLFQESNIALFFGPRPPGPQPRHRDIFVRFELSRESLCRETVEDRPAPESWSVESDYRQKTDEE